LQGEFERGWISANLKTYQDLISIFTSLEKAEQKSNENERLTKIAEDQLKQMMIKSDIRRAL
jgi:hypothetical protein